MIYALFMTLVCTLVTLPIHFEVMKVMTKKQKNSPLQPSAASIGIVGAYQ